jgi:choline dehydrogenase-like flavoprotein
VTRYDVCVVGSGPGGGIAAYALAKAGLKVALLEAGPHLRAGIDYGRHAMPWEVLDQLATGEYVRNTAFGLRERNHFTPVGDRPDHGWLKAVGGRSLCWAGHTLRFGPADFRSWPIRYDEVAPYYSRAERYMGVYGNKDGLWNLPDGEYSGPIGMRCGERLLQRGVARLKAKGAKMELVEQRKAMLTGDHPSGRALCHFCGKCNGCCVDAKYTSANTPILNDFATHPGQEDIDVDNAIRVEDDGPPVREQFLAPGSDPAPTRFDLASFQSAFNHLYLLHHDPALGSRIERLVCPGVVAVQIGPR